ncbi:fimbrial protein [Pseudomonas sp. PDNC002]|uniref:fimbrial protein n=1 Tax=Pseudomonas sp. PDNC002 TaxID=2811422 RepID=UPI001964E58C|nr:fimbrial protein [Pseudomonas sp. PDNC002]QRY81713.1 fimbrial protein [Pseudomonas sp. PDNC002]
MLQHILAKLAQVSACRRYRPWLGAVLTVIGVMVGEQASATCYTVTATTTGTPTGNNTIKASEGVLVPYSQLPDAGRNGSLGLPNILLVNTDLSIQPAGTVLATSVMPFTKYAITGGYDPNAVFWRCAPGDDVAEMFSMHGNVNPYGSALNNQAKYGGNVYSTKWADVGIRITNLASGQTYDNIFKTRSFDKSTLDRDSAGYLLIKAKNFSDVKFELIRVDPADNALPGSEYKSAGSYDAEPWAIAYTLFYNTGAANAGYTPKPGDPGNYTTGFRGYGWVGMVGFYKNIYLRRSATCAVTNVTPVVNFPTIMVNELNSGQSRTQPFVIESNCQAGAIVNSTYSDTSYGSFVYNSSTVTCGQGMSYQSYNNALCLSRSGAALGLLPTSANAIAQAQAMNLQTASGGLTYLLSDNYGISSDVAKGVGIQISRNNQPMNLLSNQNSANAATDAAANLVGWYKLVDTNTMPLGGGKYRETFQAKLTKLPGVPNSGVTSGKVSATARVLIQVQ